MSSRVAAVVLVALFAGATDAAGQANCTRTLSGNPFWDDTAYSEKSMSYKWSSGQTPGWFAGAVAKWNACAGSPALSIGAGGAKTWTVLQQASPTGGCGYIDAPGNYGPPRTIYLAPSGTPGCSDPLPNLFLHEAGHSLGLGHDGPGCPTTVMTGDPSKPLANHVSAVNCTAVQRFKQEKINRDKGIKPGGGNSGGGSNPNRGTDPVSRCTEDPDNCEETEEELKCEGTWDPKKQAYTLTCSY